METIDLAFLEKLAKERRFEDRTLEVAKRMFIHGQSPKHVSLEFGVSLPRAYAIRRDVLNAAKALPRGWIEVKIAGPKAIIEKLQRQLREELAGH